MFSVNAASPNLSTLFHLML
uniref:Uncharacterized protein n=1 Tax=Arundo donax TaxID=35708 RepID=A0A0A8YLG2_ARUDO